MNQQPDDTIALSAERAVLGAALIERDALIQARSMLTTVDFVAPQHRDVWDSMLEIDKRGVQVDPVTLEDELRTRGVWAALGMLYQGQAANGMGSFGWIAEIITAAPSATNVRAYAEIVARRAALRRLRAICADLANEAETNPDDAQRLMLEGQKLLTQISKGRTRPGVDVADLVSAKITEFQEREEARQRGSARLVGLSTGITGVDYLTGGLVPKTLNIVAARTSIGKTAYACQMALLNALDADAPTLIFSLEMSPGELVERFFARRALIDSARLRTGEIVRPEWTRLYQVGNELSRPGQITISNASTMAQIWTEARAFRVENQNRRILLVVDYVQKVRTGERGRTREQEVAEVSAGLKEIAMELDAPVVAPAQLNRGPENAGEERDPRITDIRESGAVENDADVILLLSRRRSEAAGRCVIAVAKNRNGGPLGEAIAEWRGATYELVDPPDQPRPEPEQQSFAS